MPLFDYKCPACSHQVEVLVRNASQMFQECPTCKGQMEKQPAAPGFRVKGFSNVNGYSRTDTGWVRDPKNPGIKTRVTDAPAKEE